jgi:[ribosomal protein S18]-alanine N-acetyltransferase
MIRRLEPVDFGAVQQIIAESPEAAAWSSESLQQIDDHKQIAWVIEAGGVVVGFLVARAVADVEAEILNLGVAQNHRRAGIASTLLQSCLVEFREAHVARVFLEVRESNHAAISLYEKNGFARTGRRPKYYRNPDEAAVLLVRELTA